MAWMITRTRVRRVQKKADGAEHEEKFVYAGIMTYEKRDGRWVRGGERLNRRTAELKARPRLV